MRFIKGEYYHVFNRGVGKRSIFIDDRDRWRFLTILFAFQGDVSFPQVGRLIYFVKHRMFDNEIFREVGKRQRIQLINFCLMQNHFHCVLEEHTEGGISRYMQRVLNAYTKYFNERHQWVGHLFQGKFKSVHINRNDYLLYLSAYIHLNPRELKGWAGKEAKYPWSSFQDFVGENRWGTFLKPDIITEQFTSRDEYRTFVEETPAKLIQGRVRDLFVKHPMFDRFDK